jgi:hypothetical protein
MIRCLLTLVGLLFAGSVGAFLLYVPAFSVMTVSLLLFGVLADFLLGVYVGYGQSLPANATLPKAESPESTADWEVLRAGNLDHAA